MAPVASRRPVFDYHCLSDLGAITVVFTSFLMAASHVGQFVFLTGVCRGALSVCKHFCCSVCRRGGGVIIDSSGAGVGVIAFAWQANI